jgi:hypothetical protein
MFKQKLICAIKFAENVVRCKFISKLDIFSLISLTDNNLVTLILEKYRSVWSHFMKLNNVIACILIILSVFVFLFFFSIVIGNNLIKQNYFITFYYYRLITKCNYIDIILINWLNCRPVWQTWHNHRLHILLVLLYLT